MKILFATPYIYDKEYSEFTRNRTGFGIMVKDIFDSVACNNETFLYSHVFTKGHNNILSHTLFQTIYRVSISDVIQAIKWFFTYRQPIKDRIRYAAYCLNKGLMRHYLKKINPEVVHIHGIGTNTKVFIEVCDELSVPYIVTLHGLIGLNDTVSAPTWDKKLEKEFLIDCEKRKIPVTVISSGMKKRIEENYLFKSSNSISVITNGTNVKENFFKVKLTDLRREFNISSGVKIAVVVGTLCERKNQIQVVEAFEFLSKYERENVCIFMCGVDCTDGLISNVIIERNLSNNIFLLGYVPHEEIDCIYEQADFNIVASVDEGFGLSIIEAYKHGLPTVTFGDIDSVNDLYHRDTMVVCDGRTSESLAKGISYAISKSWNRDFIIEFSKSFSLEKMAEKYLEEYTYALNRGGNGICKDC